jgi:DNA (cytosine-5)-methyltransferase 1
MISHLELFAGIGGFRQAIELLGNDFAIENKCIGFSEIDQFATKTYKANFNIINEIEIGDIEKFAECKENIESINKFNLLTGGFPCQSFSMMGHKKGFNDKRGDLFFKIIDILKIQKPEFVLLENVKNLKTHNNGETLRVIIDELKHTGYPYVFYDIFNTSNFNLAQIRNRVFIFASRVPLPQTFNFSQNDVLESFERINKATSILKQTSVLDVLKKSVEEKYYLSDKIKPTILANGSKKFISKSEINQLIARPLTASMVKMHRACQDNYYSDDFINSNSPVSYLERIFTKKELENQRIRKLTPTEALALQGFGEEFQLNAKLAGVSNHQMLKQAGNAVSVNTAYAILYHLFVKNKLNNSKS